MAKETFDRGGKPHVNVGTIGHGWPPRRDQDSHDRLLPRRVRDGEPSLCARRLPRTRRLRQEHDYRRGPDGRRHPRRLRCRRPDAPDARARPSRPPGWRAEDRRLPQQVRPRRGRRDARPRRDGSPRAPFQVRLRRRQRPCHPRRGLSRDPGGRPIRPPRRPRRTTRRASASTSS